MVRHAIGTALPNRSRKQLVRNVSTGRVLPCCYGECEKDGDNRYQVRTPHEDPRWRDEVTGEAEKRIYIFCGDAHRELWVAYYRMKERGELPT